MTSQRTRLRMVERLRQQGIADEVVLAVMAELPRHLFVDEALMSRAYDDVSLPLGFGQTISQPYIVAKMTSLLRNGKKLGRVLEIGTGCGYQTSILAKLAKEVYSVERIAPLLDRTRLRLREFKFTNVRLKHADGHLGLPEAAPYDAILMTAAASHVPEELVSQLAPGGRLIMPIGLNEQKLHCFDLTEEGLQQQILEPVKFVPLLPGLG
ncbi:protein-L-isoaspartate(D-aspartate) O-methyltransferase [Leeia sp. TBRC 13508]|uniref:Protein-L-isoaspartate O-methyltransferase n=2 Tax=Leeia speluncae TaxID=2884804 RepID=A0ABS8D7Z7_9NEIS|nr:protein-L-isoaspartate(D-aspartate) O-methyltransferase [Leeia speluncae]MCB6184320.1 protein-L-isoaspartate(D-aspartate) O-methyltransferase [Leeia speluncae]